MTKIHFPAGYPFVPVSQQYEGLKFITKQFNIYQFERSLTDMISVKFITKSFKYRMLKRFRKIIGMSYEEYKKGRRHELNRSKIDEGGDFSTS